MKKKFLACILTSCMVAGLLVGCNGGTTAPSTGGDVTDDGNTGGGSNTDDQNVTIGTGEKGTINLWAFTDEVPNAVKAYVADHPDFGYSVETTIKATDGDAYNTALAQTLTMGGKDAPDIYLAEAGFILKYSQGDYADYACPYEDLGIDVAGMTKAADIAQYTIDLGTRPSDNKLVALGYQSTGSAMIYRRSIAKDVWGTDDPAEIEKKVGGGSGSWETFWKAADELKAKGYAAVSGPDDLWNPVEKSTGKWLTDDGKLTIDKGREEYFDICKTIYDNDYSNKTTSWGEAWFAGMNDSAEKKVFAYFGPAWLINYTIGANAGDTAGDWAVCPSPIGFFWGGTWVLVNKDVTADAEKTAAIKELVEWITLDTTEDGFLYHWANGTLNGGDGSTKDTVSSGVVMSMSDGTMPFLGGQNMYDAFVPANQYASGKGMTQYDDTIAGLFKDQAILYAEGQKSKEDGITAFKNDVKDKLDIEAAE